MQATVLTCESYITRVALFSRGAEVTRRVILPAQLPEGAVEIVLERLTAQLDPAQLVARLSGRREVLGLRSRALGEETGDLSPRSIRGELRLAREAREAEREVLTRLLSQCAELSPSLPRGRSRTLAPSSFHDALAAGRLLAERQGELEARVRTIDEELASLPLPDEEDDLPAAPMARARQVRIRLSPGAEVLDLTLSYYVPAARWWPAYTARFYANEHRTELALEAFVVQRSGEDWSGVELSLCTADLPSGTQPPEVTPLRAARPSQPPPRRAEPPPAPDRLDLLFRGYDEVAGAVEDPAPPPPPVGDDADLERLVLAGPERPLARGRLCSEEVPMGIELPPLEAPPMVQEPSATRGWFETRYESRGLQDVPSDGRARRLQLRAAEANAVLKFRTIPRESQEAYRQALIPNPFGVTLLAGPIDVFVNGALLATTPLATLDRGGLIAVGLGTEERVRVSRESRAEEGATGLLGGRTVVIHTVTVTLSSALPRLTKVEVLERLPVSEDRSVEIELLGANPPAESYDQSELNQPVRGGLLWRLELAAGARASISYQYRVSLPARSELVGGNRRD